jgi:hypothetical protein
MSINYTEINQDNATGCIREDIKIKLTDKQYSNVKLLAYKAGFENVGELISSFVGDLTGWHPNGIDESELAADWYQRAFGMNEYYSYFRYHLSNYDYCLNEMKKMIKDYEFFNQVYEEYLGECYAKNVQSKEDSLKELEKIVSKGKEL